MSQHDYVINNDTAANVRADINTVLLAIVSNNSGASAPATTYANQWWYDSTTDILKIRSEANDAWISVAYLNQTSKQFFPVVGGVAVTATGTELNVLAGIPATLTATELGYVDGVTSAIQTQLGLKANLTTNTFTGAQIGSVTALTSTSASIAINLATNCNFSHTTTENTTLAAPSNPVAGQSGIIVITQGATARTLAYNTFYKFAGGTVPTLTATASAIDTFVYYVESATRATCQLIKDVK